MRNIAILILLLFKIIVAEPETGRPSVCRHSQASINHSAVHEHCAYHGTYSSMLADPRDETISTDDVNGAACGREPPWLRPRSLELGPASGAVPVDVPCTYVVHVYHAWCVLVRTVVVHVYYRASLSRRKTDPPPSY